jgi:hypothetical protein
MTRHAAIALAFCSCVGFAIAIVGCEDGPTQTFAPGPAPTNAGGSPFVATGHQRYAMPGLGTAAGGACSPDERAKVWAWAMQQPIIPPNSAAGADLGGDATGCGLSLTKEDVEQKLCLVDDGGPGPYCLGDGCEVWFDIDASGRAVSINIWTGYIGEVTAFTPDAEGKDKWELPLAPSQIRKNGSPVEVDWQSADRRGFDRPFNQMYRAWMHTFAPEISLEPIGTSCFDTGRCIQGSYGDVGYFYVPALGFAFWVDNVFAPQPAPSMATRLDLELVKVLAFSFANPFLKLDSQGPIADAGELQTGRGDCTLGLGMSFTDFIHRCVEVTGDATKDKTELNKLVDCAGHDSETFRFDVRGLDLDFAHASLLPDDVIHDNDVPSDGDVGARLSIDQSAFGVLANDHVGNDPNAAKDLHGAGAVYAEYARLARADILALAKIADGDTSKCVFPVGWKDDPTFDPAVFWSKVPAYCTGLEGLVTPAAPRAPGDRTNLGYPNATYVPPGGLSSGLKPGHQRVIVCDDANGDFVLDGHTVDSHHGYNSCIGGDALPTSFARVVKIFGKGDASKLPIEMRDAHFYWKEYARALAKYLTVANDPTMSDLSGVAIHLDDLTFQSESGVIDVARYVDRSFVDATHAPTTFEIFADAEAGIVADYVFTRWLYRGEQTLYAASLSDDSHALGADDTALLTNLFGSALLKSAYVASADGHSAYYCATHADPRACDGQTCPLDLVTKACATDDVGRALLSPYPGAFASTVFSLSLATPSPVTIETTDDAIASAMIRVPLFADPYDQGSAPRDPMEKIVGWTPKAPGVGFPIALNGSVDKFVTTSRLDLFGSTTSLSIDYDLHVDPTTKKVDKDGRVDFKAVESNDYLGEVFVCQDAASGDILRARLYTPAAEILDWLASHPGAYDACQIVIHYSPLGVAPDFITSLTNGVRLSITLGGGFGRVIDTVLFVPGQ